MTTPEGRLKEKVRDILIEYNVYYLMPVQMGYGAAGVDYHCVVQWRKIPIAFFIETKRDLNKDFTPRQHLFAEERKAQQNANTFKIRDERGLWRLRTWLQTLREQSYTNPLSSKTIPSLQKTP